jgi:membrane associated rhomboid family serine protease
MTWEVAVLLAASALALQLVSLVMRRALASELPYAGLLVGDLLLLSFAHATHRDSALAGWLGVALATVMVLGPRLADGLERRAFARDDLAGALRAAKLHELLMPGLGSTRRRRQLANLMEARAGGAAQVLRRLDGELATAHGDADVTTILLERVTVLFMAQRYRDCIEAATRLPSNWPEQHPVLGVYLVRAHCELGELGEASQVLRAVERGVAGRDPTMLGLLMQARLTLLAFAGRQPPVDRLLAGEARQMVSARARQFLHDTARDHAGVDVPADLAAILDDVAARAAEAARPLVRPRRRAPVTLALLVANVVVALVVGHFFGEPPSATLIRDGALFRPAVFAGEWWRAVSAMFLHGGIWHLGLNMYALLMLGRFCEEVLGPTRYFVTYVAGGLCGALGSTLNMQQAGLSVGASGAIMGLLGALIVVLILRRGTWPEAWRRALLWNLVLLGALQIYIGFQLPMIDNAAHVGGMLGGAAMALLVAPGGLFGRSAGARALVAALALACLTAFAWAGVEVARTTLAATWEKLPQKTITIDGRDYRVPTYWEHDAEHDIWIDPYIGLQLGKRVTPEVGSVPDDPEARRLIEHIAKTGPPRS